MITIIWIVAALCLVAWSLVAWGLYRLLVHDSSWVGGLGPLIDRLPFRDWLDLWMPGWQPLMRASVEAMQAMLGWLGGAAPWMIGGVWVFGALCVLAAAGLLTWFITWSRRSGSAARPTAVRR